MVGCLTWRPRWPAAVEDPTMRLLKYTAQRSRRLDIAIKDNIDIAGTVTSAGSLALAENVALKDAFLVKKLRAAGFNIFGKTNLSEWAGFRSTKSVSGWSGYGGQTSHVLGVILIPGSVRALHRRCRNLRIAIGTDKQFYQLPSLGKRRRWHETTVGLISRSGVIPIAASQDTAGALGSSVKIVARA